MSLTRIGRYGTPEEVASTALFLASDEAAFLTGETLHPRKACSSAERAADPA
jgi:NAD(P)-dependent dehydrogenase (short-subunit alcohol dehydrogenase family)